MDKVVRMSTPDLGPAHYLAVDPDTLERRLAAADVPGQHLWVFTAAWIATAPHSAADPDVLKILDRENLIGFAGPGCYKCEQQWSPRMEHRTCRGKL